MRQVALVTGASRGIGRAIALELGQAGCAVCVNYLNSAQAAQQVVQALHDQGCDAIAVQADVADGEAVAAMVRETERELGPVTVLVNNAGIAGQAQFQDITDDMWNRYLAVNLGGAGTTSGQCCPTCCGKKAAPSSTSPLSGGFGGQLRGGLRLHQGGYHRPDPISGHGAGSLGNSGQLCGPRGHQHRHGPGTGGRNPPGPWRSRRLWAGWAHPEDIAHAVAFFASDKAAFITGQVLGADGGFIV